MPRRMRDGGGRAARAGAKNRVAPGRINPGFLAAQAADRAYFEAHPDASSYMRDLVPGELPAHIRRDSAGRHVHGVIVAQTGLGVWCKAVVLELEGIEDARRDAEAQAETYRGALTGRGLDIPPVLLKGLV